MLIDPPGHEPQNREERAGELIEDNAERYMTHDDGYDTPEEDSGVLATGAGAVVGGVIGAVLGPLGVIAGAAIGGAIGARHEDHVQKQHEKEQWEEAEREDRAENEARARLQEAADHPETPAP